MPRDGRGVRAVLAVFGKHDARDLRGVARCEEHEEAVIAQVATESEAREAVASGADVITGHGRTDPELVAIANALGVEYGYLVEIALKHLIPLRHRHFLMPFFARKMKLPKSMAAISRLAKEYRVRIDVKFTVLPREQHRPRLYKGDFDLYRNSGAGLLEADVDSFLYGEFHSTSTLNWTGINDPELDKFLTLTRTSLNPDTRRAPMGSMLVMPRQYSTLTTR